MNKLMRILVVGVGVLELGIIGWERMVLKMVVIKVDNLYFLVIF